MPETDEDPGSVPERQPNNPEPEAQSQPTNLMPEEQSANAEPEAQPTKSHRKARIIIGAGVAIVIIALVAAFTSGSNPPKNASASAATSARAKRERAKIEKARRAEEKRAVEERGGEKFKNDAYDRGPQPNHDCRPFGVEIACRKPSPRGCAWDGNW